MKTYLLLAWRNLWRNKRQTLIASASVFFAVLLALVMRSMQEGSYDYMIDASVSMYTGYIQVHKDEYWDKRSIDKSMEVSEEVVKDIKAIDNVMLITPRLESFSLISYGNATKVASIIGIDPEQENRMTKLKEKLVKGKYLTRKFKWSVVIGRACTITKSGCWEIVL